MGLSRRVARMVPGARAAGRRLRRLRGAGELRRLRRLEPASRVWGLDRGTPVDRVFIERFLERHADAITGTVLEIGDSVYTRRFGRGVAVSEVLHVEEGHPEATFVGDLQTGENVPTGRFDCVILTQVLPFLWDIEGAVASVHAALRPGGVVLATVPGISQVSRYDLDRWGDYWRFTAAAVRRLFAAYDEVEVTAHGNVLLACAFLHGYSAEEIGPAPFSVDDPDLELVVTVRARRAPAA